MKLKSCLIFFFARERVLGSSEWFVQNRTAGNFNGNCQNGRTKSLQKSFTHLSKPYFLHKQNTFFSHRTCDGSIAIQNELKFETFSVHR